MRKSTRTHFPAILQSTRKLGRPRESLWKKQLDKGIQIEQIDHPQLSYIEARTIATQELMKDPDTYSKTRK